MKWLLIMTIFQLDPSGRPGEQRTAQKLFSDGNACLLAGARAKEALPKEVLTIANCIPQSAFNGPVADAPPAARPQGK